MERISLLDTAIVFINRTFPGDGDGDSFRNGNSFHLERSHHESSKSYVGNTIIISFPAVLSLCLQLDITGMNYLTQERSDMIVNTDVTKVSLNSDGHWMATVEQRDDGETNMEVRLKFWHYDSVKQR
jgi:hypothetical protein